MSKAERLPPERIYLQYYGADFDELTDDEMNTEPSAGDVCWCADKIYDTDVEYVRIDRLRELAKAAEAYRRNKQLIDNFQDPKIDAELDRVLAEYKDGGVL